MPLRGFWVLRNSARTLWRFPLRSALILLSAVLGVSGAISSVNFALGGRERVTRQLARMGANVLVVSPVQSRSVAGRARTGSPVETLNEADYAAIRREVPLFSRSSAFSVLTLLVKAGDLARNNTAVIGIEPDFMELKDWRASEGELFTVADLRGSRRVALLGSRIAKSLFGGAPCSGERIWINRVPFQISGVMVERGQSLDAANEDDQVYVPLSTAIRRLSNVTYYSGILLAVRNSGDMDLAAEKIRQLLRKRHRSIGRLPEDFQVLNQKQLIDAQVATSARLMFFVRSIGVSALGVSGLGVLAISWIGVRERTREIGTRRALGATRSDIFLQISTEAAALAVFGSALGTAVALQCTRLLAQWASQPLVFDVQSAWLATAFSVILNLLFAVVPARFAAGLDPIEALRFE